MMRKLALALALFSALCGRAQQHTAENCFTSPFDFPLLLSANFGELRPNHFHNGIDIKTQGVTGKPVRCVAAGYVARVAVLHGGYGQVVYVNHPNGLTSVYGHVISFAPAIQQAVRAYQYARETFVCDLTFAPGELPVRQGEVIALSGNEGASAGPHLHLELRRTATNEYIDPMPYFKRYLKDTKPPVASLVGFYPVPGQGVVDGSAAKKLAPVSRLGTPVTAWGKIYTGISAKDYMDGTSNFYGVHSVTLYVDSAEVFRSVTDAVMPDENRMINAFTDFEELSRTRRLIMRSYKSPGNRLRLLHTDGNRGVVDICEERDYRFRYVLEDNFGNRRTYSFTVRGRKQEIPAREERRGQTLCWNRTNVVQRPGLELVVPKYNLYDDVKLRAGICGDSAGISFDYVLDAGYTPLHAWCPLSIGMRCLPVADTAKYYVVQKWGRRRAPMGGKYENGWMKTRVRSLGTFAVALDTVAPRIVPLGQEGWRASRNIRFRVSDAGSGIASYKVYVDGKFVLFALKKGVLVIQDKERVKRGEAHKVEAVVTDCCGNVGRRECSF